MFQRVDFFNSLSTFILHQSFLSGSTHYLLSIHFTPNTPTTPIHPFKTHPSFQNPSILPTPIHFIKTHSNNYLPIPPPSHQGMGDFGGLEPTTFHLPSQESGQHGVRSDCGETAAVCCRDGRKSG